jgi:TfoX/Sxy family transcriptional regulator of competence genes
MKKRIKEKDKPEIDPSFAPVVAALAGDRNVAQKRMFSSSNVLTVKGKIFAMLTRGKFVAKLPKERVDELVANGAGERFNPGHGRLMKEWVAVSAGRANWVELAKEAYRFVKQGEGRGGVGR